MTSLPDAKALQDAIDKIEIGEMQSRYMFAIDWFDADVYASLFTEDAVLEWPESHCLGRDALHKTCVGIGKYFGKLADASAPNKPARLRHFVTNRVIKITGDHAEARAYWLDLNNDNQPRRPYVAAYGLYEDQLVRTADGWRITHRKVFNEMTGESPPDNPAW